MADGLSAAMNQKTHRSKHAAAVGFFITRVLPAGRYCAACQDANKMRTISGRAMKVGDHIRRIGRHALNR